MMSKRENQPAQIGRATFIESVNGLFETATDPGTTVEVAVLSAESVAMKLHAITEGKLIVENPGLSSEEHSGFLSKAEAITAVGKKALASLSETAGNRTAIQPKRKPRFNIMALLRRGKRSAPQPSFKGHGTSIKS